MDGPGTARAGGGGRLRRGAAQFPLSGRDGAAIRPGGPLPARQVRRRGRHGRDRTRDRPARPGLSSALWVRPGSAPVTMPTNSNQAAATRDIGVRSRGAAVRLPAALAATMIGLLTVAEPSIAAPGPRPTRHGHPSESVHVRVPGVGVDIGEKNVLVTIRSPHPVSSALVQVLVPPVEVQILPRPVVPVRPPPVAPAVSPLRPPAPAVPRPRAPPAALRTTAP